jgi:hypothetical protein
MTEKNNAKKLQARYERLQASIAALKLVQIGTVTTRIDRRTNAKGQVVERGPYHQWTFKEGGKTRTINLSAEQVAPWNKAIANHRRLEKILAQMRAISLTILQQTTTGVRSRKNKEE